MYTRTYVCVCLVRELRFQSVFYGLYYTISGLIQGGRFKYTTSGLGVLESYKGVNLSPQKYLHSTLLEYTHPELGHPDHRNILHLYSCLSTSPYW